jgi:hypothetical protein
MLPTDLLEYRLVPKRLLGTFHLDAFGLPLITSEYTRYLLLTNTELHPNVSLHHPTSTKSKYLVDLLVTQLGAPVILTFERGASSITITHVVVVRADPEMVRIAAIRRIASLSVRPMIMKTKLTLRHLPESQRERDYITGVLCLSIDKELQSVLTK